MIFSAFIYISMSNAMLQGAESLIKAHAAQVASIIEVENGNARFDEPFELTTSGTYITIYNSDNSVIEGSKVHPIITDMKPSFNVVKNIEINDSIWLVYDQPIYDNNVLVAWVRASRSLMPVGEALKNLRTVIFVAIPLCMLIAIGGGLFLSGRALAPIDHITKTARAIGRGDLSRRLNLPNIKDEVGNLATTFDEMLDRLETSFKKERQFTSDASHELRTPVAVITAQAEDALAGNRDMTSYREALETILKESKKMGNIISQLLMLTRGDEKKYKPVIEDIDLVMIATEVLNEMEGLASKKNVSLYLDSPNELHAMMDQTLITQLFINLIDNAVKYNYDNGWVKISLSGNKDKAYISVEDNGIGISDEDIPHIFDRFYRVDKSRKSDGTGLGLSIVKWIIDIHKGNISVQSVVGKGSKFIVKLPKYNGEEDLKA
jgi:signal transduction histidine kinase